MIERTTEPRQGGLSRQPLDTRPADQCGQDGRPPMRNLIAQSFLALLAACIRPRAAYIPSGEIVRVFRQRATR